jgi:PEP-CTERM motif
MARRHFIAGLTGVALAAVVSSTALASNPPNPPFTLNPDGASTPLSSQGAFTANIMQLSGNDLLTFAGAPFTANSFTSSFVAQATVFENANGIPIAGNGGLGSTYNIFIEASVEGTPTGCTSTQCGWDVTVANWTMVGDVGTGDSMSTGALPSTNPAITGTDTLVPLATGSLVTGTATYSISTNQFSINLDSSIITCTAAGQALLEAVNGITTCDANEVGPTQFFESPLPFFNIAFDAWTATQPTSEYPTNCGPTTCTIVLLIGQPGVFNFVTVPEPASLLVFGSGLLGFGFVGLRRRKKENNKAS